MSRADCETMLGSSRLGTLALAEDSKAYAIPLFFSFDGDMVWFQTHPGLKDEYLEATRDACLVVSHMGSENLWESVHVFGKVEKVTLTDDLEAARAALMDVPLPPASGNYPKGKPVRTDRNMYYLKLKPTHIEGKKSAWKS